MWAPKRTLGPVTGRAIAGHGVVADKVGLPLHASGIDVDQQRRVGGHDDEVAVAFEAGRPGCVAEPSLDGCRFRGSCRWAVRVRRARADGSGVSKDDGQVIVGAGLQLPSLHGVGVLFSRF
jgi:hypothetical protein